MVWSQLRCGNLYDMHHSGLLPFYASYTIQSSDSDSSTGYLMLDACRTYHFIVHERCGVCILAGVRVQSTHSWKRFARFCHSAKRLYARMKQKIA